MTKFYLSYKYKAGFPKVCYSPPSFPLPPPPPPPSTTFRITTFMIAWPPPTYHPPWKCSLTVDCGAGSLDATVSANIPYSYNWSETLPATWHIISPTSHTVNCLKPYASPAPTPWHVVIVTAKMNTFTYDLTLIDVEEGGD